VSLWDAFRKSYIYALYVQRRPESHEPKGSHKYTIHDDKITNLEVN
jgi:hypothetical protein